jgi:two-component system cell cycle response regulator
MVALILLDIDHFKQLNDLHGHQVGDDILRQFAERLNAVAKRVGDAVCRYGGEEFAIILPATDSAAAEQVAQRVLALISETPFSSAAGELAVTVSAGVAAITPAMQHPEQIIEAADKALYEAKNSGRNQLVLAR